MTTIRVNDRGDMVAVAWNTKIVIGKYIYGNIRYNPERNTITISGAEKGNGEHAIKKLPVPN